LRRKQQKKISRPARASNTIPAAAAPPAIAATFFFDGGTLSIDDVLVGVGIARVGDLDAGL
jgi:hypothetical protein